MMMMMMNYDDDDDDDDGGLSCRGVRSLILLLLLLFYALRRRRLRRIRVDLAHPANIRVRKLRFKTSQKWVHPTYRVYTMQYNNMIYTSDT